MKTLWIKAAVLSTVFASTAFYAQESVVLPNMNSNNKDAINTFEAPKDNSASFDGMKMKWGAAFTAQYQDIKHENDVNYTTNPTTPKLYDLKSGLQVPMANLYMDVQLADGIRLNVTSYMSSRHHNEFYVKGGYLQIDKLPFLKSDLVDRIMEKVTIKAGQFENNYGDTHFRRTDGGQALYNPFIENYIVDAFATEVGAEVYYRPAKNWVTMVGVTSGSIKGHVTTPATDADSGDATRSLSVYGKVAYDTKLDNDLRLRFSASGYHNPHNGGSGLTMYWGDRTGSNYQLVMETVGADVKTQAWSGRINPSFGGKQTSGMFNAFAEYKGLEFFGTYEIAKGRQLWETKDRDMSQFAADLIYRFGPSRNFFVGGRYNVVNLDTQFGTTTAQKVQEVKIDRFVVSGGWFMTKNILMKLEYMNQKYNDYPTNDYRYGGKFNGLVFEATIGF